MVRRASPTTDCSPKVPVEHRVDVRRAQGFEAVVYQHASLLAASVIAAGFVWRLWLAQATFLGTDEAWHFALANQPSFGLAYKASLTISHPPLLILVTYVFRVLGTSNLVLRLPAVIAGSVFCWLFYRWLSLVAGQSAASAGLIFAAFLPPMISTSAEVRQNPLLLLFAMGAIYFFDRALTEDSALAMLVSSASLCLAMLSHYSAFFIAGALGIYAILRMLPRKPAATVSAAWCAGQVAGVALAAFLYKTHLGRLGSALKDALPPQQYLYSSYFHRGQDHLLPFLYRGTFGVFRFVYGQTQIGQLMAVLFVVGVVFLFINKPHQDESPRLRSLGVFLLLPFVLSWMAAAASFYPYGRMRQCMFLAIFCLAGVSICLARIAKEHSAIATALAVGIVILCHAFGTLQDRDAYPLADQRHEHMDAAMQLIRSQVQPSDVILTDRATSYQLLYYLCQQKRVPLEPEPNGFETFRCDGRQVLSTGAFAGALTADSVAVLRLERPGPLATAREIWVVQGGWGSGLGEALRKQSSVFSVLNVHSFGRYLEVFEMPSTPDPSIPVQRAR